MKRSIGGIGLLAAGLGLVLWAGVGADAETRSGEPARGEQLYEQMCAACHGPYGRGDGPVADQLARPLPDFTQPEVLGGRSDEQVRQHLAGAGEASRHTPMVVAQAIEPEAMRAAIAYIRTLSVPGKHVSVAAGRDVYQSFCWLCHGREGQGDGPAAANLPGPKPRDFTSEDFRVAGREDELARTITRGAAESFHGSEYMLEWGTKLAPQQVKDVIAYLATFQDQTR